MFFHGCIGEVHLPNLRLQRPAPLVVQAYTSRAMVTSSAAAAEPPMR